MAIALRNPITAKVDDRASFLRTLLEEYPRFLNEWENSTEEEFAQTAKDNADGDRKTNSLKRLSELNIGFDYDDNTLIFTDSKLIIDVLDKMHMVLHELCEKFGYKTKYIGK